MKKQETNLIARREQGLNYVTKARSSYTEANEIVQKETAVKLFKEGLEILIKYMKGKLFEPAWFKLYIEETNARIIDALKPNAKKWLNECQKMTNEIKFIKGNCVNVSKKPIVVPSEGQKALAARNLKK